MLKENLGDPDIAIALELLDSEPDLKKALVELHLMTPKRKAFFVDPFISQIRARKRQKDKF